MIEPVSKDQSNSKRHMKYEESSDSLKTLADEIQLKLIPLDEETLQITLSRIQSYPHIVDMGI